MRTDAEIKTEIAALKALQPIGEFRDRTGECINAAIEELEFGVDQTVEEWEEMSDGERDIVLATVMWREGNNKVGKPSEGWGKLVK